VRKTEAARVKLMSVSDDTIQKARRYHFGPFYWFCMLNVLTSYPQATKVQAVVRGHLARTLRKQVLVTPKNKTENPFRLPPDHCNTSSPPNSCHMPPLDSQPSSRPSTEGSPSAVASSPPANSPPTNRLFPETMGCRLQDSTVGACLHGEEPGVCSQG
jgi:hypothetical protein